MLELAGEFGITINPKQRIELMRECYFINTIIEPEKKLRGEDNNLELPILEKRIIDVLKKTEKGMLSSKIADILNIDRQKSSQALTQLIEKGMVIKSKVNFGNAPYYYYNRIGGNNGVG